MFFRNRHDKRVVYRLEDLEKRRRSIWIISALLMVSLGFGFYVTLIPGDLTSAQPLFGTLPVLRVALLVLLVLLSVYIIRGEVDNSHLLRELWEKKVNIDTLNQRVMELSVLHDVSAAINSILDMDKTTNVIMDSAFKLMAAETGFVMVTEGDSREFQMLISRNLGSGGSRKIVLNGEGGVLAQAYDDGKIVLEGSAGGDAVLASLVGQDRSVASAVCAPLKHKGRVAGLFCLANLTYENSFDQRDVELLAIFADQVAIALENARLFQNLEKSLAELKEAQEKMIQTSKLAAVGQLAAGVAHELNNPIVGILGYAQYAVEKIKNKDASELSEKDLENYRKYLGYIEHESQRCKVIIQNLLNYSRKDSFETQPTDVNKVLAETFTFTTHQLQKNGVQLRQELADGLPPINGNPPQLQQVFTNIMINAAKAMPEGGSLTVVSRLSEDTEDGGVAVEVDFTDTGCGMTPEVQRRIFDPFFTTRKVGEGTGLGLALTQGIIKNHGGEIRVKSAPNRGTTFTIVLPVNHEVSAQAEPTMSTAYSVGVGRA